MGLCVLCKSNGLAMTVSFGKEENTLEWLQSQVCGYIESAPLNHWLSDSGMVVLVNEEGRIDGLPINKWASVLCEYPVCGDAVILKADGEELAGMSAIEATSLAKIWEWVEK